MATFVRRNGLARGLMDYTGVTAVEIPMDVIVRRAQAAPMLPGQTRVIVAPNEPSYSLNRVIAAHQYFARKVEPLLVESVRDGLCALGSGRFEFAPIHEDDRMRLERQAFAVLAEIDAAAEEQVARYRRLAAASRQRRSEAEGISMQRRSLSFITVSDLFNTVLRHAQLSDHDLSIRCPRCRRKTTLAACPILVGRQTRYICGDCSAWLVQLLPLTGRRSATTGYSFGDFELHTSAEITCRGSVLPKSR